MEAIMNEEEQNHEDRRRMILGDTGLLLFV